MTHMTHMTQIKAAPHSLLLMALGLSLAACASININPGFRQDPALHGRIIDQTEDRYPQIDPLHLSEEMKAYVDDYIRRPDGEETRVHKLQRLLFDEDFLNLQYSDERTHTAQEAFAERQGNCLSAMNLYVAMARYAGVDANFQTVKVRPSWDKRGDLLVLAQHINATGKFSYRRHYVVDFTPEIALQQLTASVVDDAQARALYFSNLGVEAMIEGDLDSALAYFKNALFIEPELSVAWNNIGAVYKRTGEPRLAEYSYQMAFATDDTNSTAINNLAKFYLDRGDAVRAQEYALAIERFNERNPYTHYARGHAAWEAGDLEVARDAFRRAMRLKAEEPDFYIALATVYVQLGSLDEARQLRDDAAQLMSSNQEIYRPSDKKVRIIDSATILRDSSAGISIIPAGGRTADRLRVQDGQ